MKPLPCTTTADFIQCTNELLELEDSYETASAELHSESNYPDPERRRELSIHLLEVGARMSRLRVKLQYTSPEIKAWGMPA